MLLTTRDRLRKQMREVGWGGGGPGYLGHMYLI